MLCDGLRRSEIADLRVSTQCTLCCSIYRLYSSVLHTLTYELLIICCKIVKDIQDTVACNWSLFSLTTRSWMSHFSSIVGRPKEADCVSRMLSDISVVAARIRHCPFCPREQLFRFATFPLRVATNLNQFCHRWSLALSMIQDSLYPRIFLRGELSLHVVEFRFDSRSIDG
jgi:hypothetical protein